MIGMVLGFGLMLLYVPMGSPDAAEITFTFGLLTIVAGLGVGLPLGRNADPRVAKTGDAVLGVGLGAAIGFLLVFFTPFLGAL